MNPWAKEEGLAERQLEWLVVTGLFLSNENPIEPAVGLLSLVLREASEGRSGQEIIVEGQIGTKGSPFNHVYS